MALALKVIEKQAFKKWSATKKAQDFDPTPLIMPL